MEEQKASKLVSNTEDHGVSKTSQHLLLSPVSVPSLVISDCLKFSHQTEAEPAVRNTALVFTPGHPGWFTKGSGHQTADRQVPFLVGKIKY